MKSWVNICCWHGHSQAKDSMPQTHGNGKAFFMRVSLGTCKTFLWSRCGCWQCVQLWVFMNSWLVCAKTSNSNFFTDVHSLKLLAYRKLLLRQANLCAVHNKCTEVPSYCIVGTTPSECTAHLTPVFRYVCLCVCAFLITPCTQYVYLGATRRCGRWKKKLSVFSENNWVSWIAEKEFAERIH